MAPHQNWRFAVKLNKHEDVILALLASRAHDWGHHEPSYFSFAAITAQTGYDRKTVRRACRALKRKGLATFLSGLWDDEGPAGSGYGVTKAGCEYIETVARKLGNTILADVVAGV